MRTFRLIGMALLAVVMCVNFTSCSDDDEEEISASLEGTWYYDYGEGWELYNGNKEPWSTDPDPYNPNDRDASIKMERKWEKTNILFLPITMIMMLGSIANRKQLH